MFNASNAAHTWSPLCLERSMEFYSSQELEYLVKRRESEEVKRKTLNKLSSVLTRRLPIGNSGIGAFTLINGGRWLLTACYFGSVSYYDLDSQTPVKRLLIPRIKDQFSSFHTVVMAVDIDDESPVLSFNVALYLERNSDRAAHLSPRIQIVQVWHITLELDDQNRGTRLSATRLSLFLRENYGLLRFMSLLGGSIAFGVEGTREDYGFQVTHHLAIVDWAEANVQNRSHRRSELKLSYRRKIIAFYTELRWMRLLPGQRICIGLAARYGAITLYYTSGIQATTDIPPSNALVWHWQPIPDWRFNPPLGLGFPRNVSQLYRCRNTNNLRLVFNTDKGIYGITFSCESDITLEPVVIKLKNLKPRTLQDSSLLCLGYNAAMRKEFRLGMLYYSWPDEAGSPLGPSKSLTLQIGKKSWREEEYPDFDETSGRVVAESCHDEILVYDFSAFQNVV
ncbi:hypothetical protein M413DRAFT_29339 [Hebeloma cylindrosporum]|uniref:Uncharacterized protein n=1 Tax=Hebeloma cylindrosporum TaxID=76867 RepID=A0A0C3C603_HEBCY|nr:hypothetical protein M413DRAFT_29339 [Hebeloma cylindrosporum h7]